MKRLILLFIIPVLAILVMPIKNTIDPSVAIEMISKGEISKVNVMVQNWYYIIIIEYIIIISK